MVDFVSLAWQNQNNAYESYYILISTKFYRNNTFNKNKFNLYYSKCNEKKTVQNLTNKNEYFD